MSGARDPLSQSGVFPTTSWSSLLQSAQADADLRRRTLEKLFVTYWRPVYCCARFGWKLSPEDAEDAVQSFFLELLERDFPEGIAEGRGRFRNYLKKALKHFLLNVRRDRGRAKRGGLVRLFPLEEARQIASREGDPEQIFDQEWIKTLLQRAREWLREDLMAEKKEAYYRVFELYDLGEGSMTYQEAAGRIGISESDVRNYLHAARDRFRSVVIQLVRDYAVDAEDAGEELGWVLG